MTLLRATTAAAAFALFAAACSDSATSPDTTGLTAAQAEQIADVVTTDADAMVSASSQSPASGFMLAPSAATPVIASPPCFPSVSPANPANVDGDAVPDSVRLDFNACASASGFIDILDPTLVTPDWGIRSVFTDFTITRSRGPRSRMASAVFNGARQVTGNSDQINHLITNFETDLTFPNETTIQHVKNWNATFVADVAGSIQHAQPLPSGTLNLAGSSTWTKGTESWSMTITTSGLHFDASCTVEPRFDAGTTTIVVDRNGRTHTVTIEHTACGQFTVTRTN